MSRVVVIGGGIGGLSCAYALRQAEPRAQVVVLESAERTGGKVRTVRQSGFVIEAGPDAFLHGQPEAVDLCREVGLGDALIDTNSRQNAVYVLVNGRLSEVPRGLMMLAPPDPKTFLRSGILSWRGRLRAALEPWIRARRSDGDETIGAFVTRRLGSQVTERLAQPLLGGIFGGDVNRLSLRDTFPDLASMEREYGSLTAGARARAAAHSGPGGRGAFMSLAAGLDTLPGALEAALGAHTVYPGKRVTLVQMRHASEGSYFRVETADGDYHEADDVVFALPAPAAVALIHPIAPHVARGLAGLVHVSTAVVSLGFRERDVGRPLDGYGFLVVKGEKLPIRGCTWSSSKLPGRAPEGHVLMRVFVGGFGREADVALDDDQLVETAMASLKSPLRLSGSPVVARVDRWPQAQPQYELGHRERVREIRAGCPPGVHFVGASFDGVGIPAVIRSARRTASAIRERAPSEG